jgi:hypothetical protein
MRVGDGKESISLEASFSPEEKLMIMKGPALKG